MSGKPDSDTIYDKMTQAAIIPSVSPATIADAESCPLLDATGREQGSLSAAEGEPLRTGFPAVQAEQPCVPERETQACFTDLETASLLHDGGPVGRSDDSAAPPMASPAPASDTSSESSHICR